MAELYGVRHGRDILFRPQRYAMDAYDPNEKRDEGGKWTKGGGGGGAKPAGGEGRSGSEAPKAAASSTPSSAASGKPGVVAHGPKAATEWRDKVTAEANCCKTVDDLVASSEMNQKALAEVAEQVAKEIGVVFKNPGPKKRDRLEKKLAKPGRTPAKITDAARGGFDVTKPGQADTIAAAFAKKFQIADEGWAVTNVGYLDRKLMVRFPNGQMGEVQMWPPDMLDAKELKGGHKHYEAWQALPAEDHVGQAREMAAMRALYQPVLDRLSPEWNAILGRSGSPPNASEKPSAVNM
jgi:hypothetical protein